MKKIWSRVCDNWESGTDETVYITFQLDNRICLTKYLDTGIIGDNTNDWKQGSNQTWGHQRWTNWLSEEREHNFLGNCADQLRPHDQLKFQVALPFAPMSFEDSFCDGDDLQICFLEVTFGNTDQAGSSIWEWDGKEKGVWKSGCSIFGKYLPSANISPQQDFQNLSPAAGDQQRVVFD